MTDLTERTRDNFETVYKIFHKAEYGFGGNTSVWLAVTNETDTRIEGRKFGPMKDWPGKKMVVRKENVAGWEEDNLQYSNIPTDTESQKSPEEVRKAYKNGYIDEDEMESQLEEAIE